MSTPNTTDFYTRYMIQYFDQRANFPVPRGFQSFFGNPEGAAATHFSPNAGICEIDIIKANGERLAATVHRGQSSDPTDRRNVTDYKYTNIVRQYPLIEEAANINSNQLIQRQPGDNTYQEKTRLERNRRIALDAHYDHMRKSIRTWEYWARESIISGQQSAIIGTTNTALIYDFYRPSGNTISVATAWDTGSADILGDIDAAITRAREVSGRRPDFMGIAGDAFRAFLADDEVEANADNRNYEFIRVGKNTNVPARFNRYIQNGWVPVGQLFTPLGRDIWIFTYDEVFTNNAGTTENWFPSGKALFLSSRARFDRYFGPMDRLPITPMEAQWYQQMFGFNMTAPPMPPEMENPGNVIVPQAFYFDAYVPKDNKNIVMRTQSAPIFATTETDAIVVLDGLITP